VSTVIGNPIVGFAKVLGWAALKSVSIITNRTDATLVKVSVPVSMIPFLS
jgi:hypothetical protein